MDHEPIHGWFGLSYSNYLVLPRSVLQSAPIELQERITACLNELVEEFGDEPFGQYWVRRMEGGRFVRDAFADYERGRRKIRRKSESL